MLSIKTIAIISILFFIYYYFNQTQIENFTTRAVNSMRSTSKVPSIRVDKDCEMSDWSQCGTDGKKYRDVISNYTGFGKKCESLVQDCQRTITGCDGDEKILTAPPGMIIKSGTITYGRWEQGGCPGRVPNPIVKKTYPLKYAIGKNSYKMTGDLRAECGEDPAPNVYKQYSITYIFG